MRIDEEYIKTGYFWLPKYPENKIPGILTIKNGGNIELEIIGTFDSTKDNDDIEFPRIIGHVEKDGLVTLDDCFYTKKNNSFSGISKSKLCVNKVFSGVAYDENEDITFNSVSFSVDCMDEWIGISGIRVENDWNNRTATISYSPLEKIELPLNNGMNLEICFSYTLPGFPSTTEAKITQRAYFKINSENLRPLDDFICILYKLTNFMSFAIDETVTLKNLQATSLEIQAEYASGKKHPILINVYYQSIPFVEKEPKKIRNKMLFCYREIESNIQELINHWFTAYDVIEPALNLYFSTKSGGQKYIEGKFLALVQGLETYHRRTSDEKIMDSSQFDELRSKIMSTCPEEYKDWLKGRLMHGNEIALGKRIKRIIEPFKNLFGNSNDRNKLIRKIVDTRNYLTHYSIELKDSSAHGKEELWVLTQKLEVIFQLHFLKVIGFTDNEINSVVKNSRPIKYKLYKI